jgi:hypothetical protein
MVSFFNFEKLIGLSIKRWVWIFFVNAKDVATGNLGRFGPTVKGISGG